VSGAFVCNIGDCLMRWTNGVYASTPHRVRAPAAERFSAAFFLDPTRRRWWRRSRPAPGLATRRAGRR
jgi:isopenicillin N synthase-like dioxygenase